MEIKEYLASGILESYVLGLTTLEENLEVEKFAALYPEINKEIEAIEESLNKLAEKERKSPAPEIKENIFARIRDLEKEELKSKSAKIINMAPEIKVSENHFSWWAAAAITLLVISSGINILLYNRWKSAEGELATINNEKEILAGQYKIERTVFDQASKDLQILKQPGLHFITLKGSKIAPSAVAMIYWNNQSQEVYLNISSLPAPPSDKQYQLWAIVNGTPVDAGILEMAEGKSYLQKMKSFENAQAFAITLENKGGSTTPHLEALYVIGNV